MNPVFVFLGMSKFNDQPFARMMVSSIKRTMPGAEIIQIGDKNSKKVKGVSSIVCGNFDYNRTTFPRIWFDLVYSVQDELGENEPIIHCDADIIFDGDVSNTLVGNFDAAICKRGQDDNTTLSYRILNPYVASFIVVKNKEFWKFCSEIIKEWKVPDSFTLAQQVVGLVANNGHFMVKFLNGEIYNYIPRDINDFNRIPKVYHFKGHKKEFMVEWKKKHLGTK